MEVSRRRCVRGGATIGRTAASARLVTLADVEATDVDFVVVAS